MRNFLFIALTVALANVISGCGKKEDESKKGPKHPRRGMLTHQLAQPYAPQLEEVSNQ